MSRDFKGGYGIEFPLGDKHHKKKVIRLFSDAFRVKNLKGAFKKTIGAHFSLVYLKQATVGMKWRSILVDKLCSPPPKNKNPAIELDCVQYLLTGTKVAY